MQYLIGLLHIQNLLSTNEDCIIKILTHFLNEALWKNYEESDNEIQFSKKLFIKPKEIENKLAYLSNKWDRLLKENYCVELSYPKLSPHLEEDSEPDINSIVHAMYITLEAYLDAYSVQDVQEIWESLNEQSTNDDDTNRTLHNIEANEYSVTEDFIKKYRGIYQKNEELKLTFQDLKNRSELPSVMTVFERISLLGL
ncbi:hypothetical protein O3G_MSEX012704 [Manduca sexta]|uniref:Uncharacterized protein n=2 Tax=Manduca sexta TaxID=7130 RepID=A0A922CX41_MANSE|nr:hypothetical protein O3G_MSEX012704 [Manduca sexta]